MQLHSDTTKFFSKDLNFHNKSLEAVKWSGDGKYLGAAFKDKSVKIGQLESTGNIRVVHTVPCTHSARSVTWNPLDDQRFAIAGLDKFIELWDVRAPKATGKILAPGTNISASWSANGHYIATANHNNHLTVFDTRSMKETTKATFQYELNSVAWTANSDNLICATEGITRAGEIEIISFKDGNLDLLDSVQAHTAFCEKVAIDRGFSKLAVSGFDHTATINLGDGMIDDISFSGDGRYLALGTDSPHVMVFDAETGECISKVNVRWPSRVVAWHPTEPIMAVGVEDKGGAPCSMRMVSFTNLR